MRNTESKFSFKKQIESFSYAFNGLRILILEEHNSRIHLFAACCAVILGCIFSISRIEWIAIVFSIGLVITLEIINSSIENLADFVSPEKQIAIKKVKDLAAAGVLISAVTALIIGLLIFVPKFLELL